MAQESELIGAAEICEALDVDRSTLMRWIDRGIAVPAGRLSGPTGAFLFQRSEVERLRELRGDRKQMPREVSA